MFKAVFRIASIALAAQVGNYLGDTPHHGAAAPAGFEVGPINVTLSNFVPAVVAGTLCGGSRIYTLLTGYIMSSVVGDRFEREVLGRLGTDHI